ncbi:MAG: hypothetical protein EBR82_09565 [Caulobacteraceae bacterium]|nr:hypothetical protein [Caulobacteraceae bacterium]
MAGTRPRPLRSKLTRPRSTRRSRSRTTRTALRRAPSSSRRPPSWASRSSRRRRTRSWPTRSPPSSPKRRSEAAMGWTKKQLAAEAYGELGLQDYEFDVSPEEQMTALRRLDTMMATWDSMGIRLGYAFPSGPDASDPDTDSGLPDTAAETVYLNLAIRLAPGLGKQVSAETKRSAADGFDMLMATAAVPRQQQLPNTLPRGAGNRTSYGWPGPFFPGPCRDPLRVAQGGDLDIPQDAP